MMEHLENTNWFIITGGPSTGKSKVMDALADRGFSIQPEVARIWIDEEVSHGKDVKTQIRVNEEKFQLHLIQMKLEREARLDPQKLVFWERGVPDSIVYLEHSQGDTREAWEAQKKRYRGIFLLDPLPYQRDYARTESEEEAKRIHGNLGKVYTDLGYAVIQVPVMPISKRVDFILGSVTQVI